MSTEKKRAAGVTSTKRQESPVLKAPIKSSTPEMIVKLRALIDETGKRMARPRPAPLVPLCEFQCGPMLPLPGGWICPKCETREMGCA